MSDDAYDLGAEQSLLGSVLAAPDKAGDALLAVPADAWWTPKHRDIAEVLTKRLRRGEPIDLQLVMTDLLGRSGFGAETGPYLHTLWTRAWVPAHADDYAHRVLRCAARRNLSGAATRLRQRLDQSWLNGWDEPVTEFTGDMRTACDTAELADSGVQADDPSPSVTELLAGSDAHDWLVPGLLERGERMILTGTEGLGKALALSTPVPTPKGWTTMGELAVGSEVFGPDGRAARVVATTDVLHGRPCRRVTFSDGAQIVADRDHLWLTETLAAREAAAKAARRPAGTRPRGTDQRHKRRHFPAITTTDGIAETLLARGGHALNHSVAVTDPLQYPAQELPVDPYVLGAWLGDGTSASAAFTCADAQIISDIKAAGYSAHRTHGQYGWRITRRAAVASARRAAAALVVSGVTGREARRRVGLNESVPLGVTAPRSGYRIGVPTRDIPRIESLQEQLRLLGVLGNKHVPERYQHGSVEQRLALLQGLMDTDGTVCTGGRGQGRGSGAAVCEFSVCNRRLAADVQELLLGLGVKVTWREGEARIAGRLVGTRYRLGFQTDLPVFRLRRKSERQALLRTRRSKLRYITSIEPVRSEPVRCVQVDRSDGMFVVGRECIPTHNSELIMQMATCLAAGLHPFTGEVLGSGAVSCRVLVVDCENGLGKSRRRFRHLATRIAPKAKHGWQDNLRIEIRPAGLNLLGRDAGWLQRRVAANAPDLLAIGPLYRLHLANMNDELAARELVAVLDGIRTRHGCAVLSEAHAGHERDNTTGERRLRPTGSSLFMRWPEFGFGLVKAKNVGGEHPRLVDVVAWRGSREERQWPRQLKHGLVLPWEPANIDYWDQPTRGAA